MKVADVIGPRTEVFSITDATTVHDAARYLREKAGSRGMNSVQDLLRVMASDEKARADMLEAYVLPQR